MISKQEKIWVMHETVGYYTYKWRYEKSGFVVAFHIPMARETKS